MFEMDYRLQDVWVQGEISNLSRPSSGHVYFSLKDSGAALTEGLVAALARRCNEFLVHSVDAEGRLKGIDTGLVVLLADISPLTTTYAGGIRSIKDLEEVRTRGKGRVDATIGSALDIFGGSLRYNDVVAWQRKQEKRRE